MIPGKKVRVLEQKEKFDKRKQKFRKDIYTVDKKEGYKIIVNGTSRKLKPAELYWEKKGVKAGKLLNDTYLNPHTGRQTGVHQTMSGVPVDTRSDAFQIMYQNFIAFPPSLHIETQAKIDEFISEEFENDIQSGRQTLLSMKERANGCKFKSFDEETAINVVNAQTESERQVLFSTDQARLDMARLLSQMNREIELGNDIDLNLLLHCLEISSRRRPGRRQLPPSGSCCLHLTPLRSSIAGMSRRHDKPIWGTTSLNGQT
jgi:hypothetical protein